MSRFCSKCNAKLKRGEKFCGTCGQKVDASSANDLESHGGYVEDY